MAPVTQQIKSYFGADGLPLNNGYVYFGSPGLNPETSPIVVYWDAALTIVAPQPLRTVGGFVMRNGSPANVFASGDFSSTVKDSKGALVYTVANNVDFLATGTLAASSITVVDTGAYYTAEEVEAILQEIGASLASLATGNVPTGAMLPYTGGANPATPPAGFVFANSASVGNAASGATGRNNADTSALYTILWNNYTNTELPIQDSAGTPTTRGASAAADFAADKRMPTPDYRCRVGAGLDNMGGVGTLSLMTAAGAGIVGTTIGAKGGTQTHVLTSPGELPAHTHVQDAHTHTQDAHLHVQDAHTHGTDAAQHLHGPGSALSVVSGSGVTNIDVGGGGGSVNVYVTSTFAANNTANAATGLGISSATAVNQLTIAVNQNTIATNQNTGSGGAHQNTQPTIMETRIIKL